MQVDTEVAFRNTVITGLEEHYLLRSSQQNRLQT